MEAPLCDAPTPNDSLNHQDISPGSFTTWQQLIPFDLQRFIGVGRQHALPASWTSRLLWEECVCVSTLAECPQLHKHQWSWEEQEHPNISTQINQPPTLGNVPLPSAPRDYPKRRVLAPSAPEGSLPWGQCPLWLPLLRVHRYSHQSSRRFLTPLDRKTCPRSSWRGGSGSREAGAHPSSASSTPKPFQGDKRKKEVAYL